MLICLICFLFPDTIILVLLAACFAKNNVIIDTNKLRIGACVFNAPRYLLQLASSPLYSPFSIVLFQYLFITDAEVFFLYSHYRSHWQAQVTALPG